MFNVGDRVTIRGKAFLYGEGIITNIIRNRVEIKFSDGVTCTDLDMIRYSDEGGEYW